MSEKMNLGAAIGEGQDRIEWRAVARNHLASARRERTHDTRYGGPVNRWFHSKHLVRAAAARYAMIHNLPFTGIAGEYAETQISEPYRMTRWPTEARARRAARRA